LDIKKLDTTDRGHLFALKDAFLRDNKAKKAYAQVWLVLIYKGDTERESLPG